MRQCIAPDKDWKQLGIYPPLFGLIGDFKVGISSSCIGYPSESNQIFAMEWGLVSPDVLFTICFTFRKTDNTANFNQRQLFWTYFKNPTYLSCHIRFFEPSMQYLS